MVPGAVDGELHHRVEDHVTTANGVRAVGGTSPIFPSDVGAQEVAVEREHLAVQPVQGAEPEVAVLGELGEP